MIANWSAKRKQLQEELEANKLAGAKIRAKLEFLDELEKDNRKSTPASQDSEIQRLMETSSIKITDAVIEAMRDLRQFTRVSVENWITHKYPNLEFSPKSIQKPLRDMIIRGQVFKIKDNIGSKTLAVYSLTGKPHSS